MTSVNLNKTNNDILIEQYQSDYETNQPFPFDYILFDPRFGKDLCWVIPERIAPQDFKNALFQYVRTRGDNPNYEAPNLKVYVHPRYEKPEKDSSRQFDGGER